MLMFLYDLPNWLMGAVICAFFVIVAIAGHWVFRRVVRYEFPDEERGLAIELLAVVATMNALLLAFSAVSVWESFGAADAAVVDEADTVGQLGFDLSVFDSPESREARDLLRAYARSGQRMGGHAGRQRPRRDLDAV
jgi:hypothetical protein